MGVLLTTLARLTPAQQSLLNRVSEHSGPITAAQLAEESGLHVSSVRETLEALVSTGVVVRHQLPSSGRGRPSIGYATHTPTDPTYAAQQFDQLVRATLAWLRQSVSDPLSAARAIGRNWGVNALHDAEVPDHYQHTGESHDFSLAGHMAKIRLFFTHLGFDAVPHASCETGLVLMACPWTDASSPDPLALAVREGIVRAVLEHTAAGHASVELRPVPGHPLREQVLLTQILPDTAPAAAPSATGSVAVTFFGGAEEAAGAHERECSWHATLGDLLDSLTSTTSALAPVLAVSSFLVNGSRADRSTPLEPGATVHVLPPFAGG